jgi:hypothetical protein
MVLERIFAFYSFNANLGNQLSLSCVVLRFNVSLFTSASAFISYYSTYAKQYVSSINYAGMTTINIQRDGSVYPPLNPDSLIVKILNGNLQIGKYEKESYLKEYDNYITEPGNAIELKNELIKLINADMPELFSKHYVVYLLCPAAISTKVKWGFQKNC